MSPTDDRPARYGDTANVEPEQEHEVEAEPAAEDVAVEADHRLSFIARHYYDVERLPGEPDAALRSRCTAVAEATSNAGRHEFRRENPHKS